ncbi:MAG: transglycosylase SLT domain-containing protein, partial [Chitinispirillia bacterium]
MIFNKKVTQKNQRNNFTLLSLISLAVIIKVSILLYFYLHLGDEDKPELQNKIEKSIPHSEIINQNKDNKENVRTDYSSYNSVKGKHGKQSFFNSGSTPAQITNQQMAVKILMKGKEYYRRGKWSSAIRYFDMIRNSSYFDSYEDSLLLLCGICSFELKEYKKTQQYIKKISNSFPLIEDHINNLLAETYFYQQDYINAIEKYNHIISTYKKSRLIPQAIMRLIKCNIEIGEETAALNQIKIIERSMFNPMYKHINPFAIVMLKAQLYGKQNKLKSEARLLSNLRLEPEAEEFHSEANIRLKQLRNKGIIYQPKYGNDLLDYIRRMQKIWVHQEVVDLIDKVRSEITENHKKYNSYTDQWLVYYQAYSKFRLLEFKSSDSMLTKLVSEINPLKDSRYSSFLLRLARIKLRSNKIQESIELLKKVHENSPNNLIGQKALYLAVWAYAEKGDFENALAGLKKYRKFYGRKALYKKTVDWLEAWFTYRQDKFDRAFILFEKIKKEGRSNKYSPAAKYWSARCLQKLGYIKQANHQFKKIVVNSNFSYYQLAASQQLLKYDKKYDELRGPLTVQKAIWRNAEWLDGNESIEDSIKSNDSPLFVSAKDTEIIVNAIKKINHEDSVKNSSLSNWKQFIYHDSIMRGFSNKNSRARYKKTDIRFKNLFRRNLKKSLKNIRRLASKYNGLYPSLQKALFWYELGDIPRTGIEISYFLDNIIMEKEIFDTTLKINNSNIYLETSDDSDTIFSIFMENQDDTIVETDLTDRLYPLNPIYPNPLYTTNFSQGQSKQNTISILFNDSIDRISEIDIHNSRKVPVESELEYKLLVNQSIDDFDRTFYMDIVTLLIDCGFRIKALRTFKRFFNARRVPRLNPHMRKMIYYPIAFKGHIQKYSDEYSVSDYLILSIMRSESFFDSLIISKANAIGLMQLLQCTAQNIKEELDDNSFNNLSLKNAEKNIKYGTWYLGQLLSQYNDQWPLAIASYNAGPENVINWLNRRPYLDFDEFIESIR